MKQIHLLGLFRLIVTVIGCGQSSLNGTKSEVDHETSENWKTIDESDYSIQYPETFILDKSGQMGMNLFYFPNRPLHKICLEKMYIKSIRGLRLTTSGKFYY